MNQVFSPNSLYGKVAQLVRACGSYPQGRGFNSLPCYHQTKKLRKEGILTIILTSYVVFFTTTLTIYIVCYKVLSYCIFMEKYFFEAFDKLRRCAPGSTESTNKAFTFLCTGFVPDKILDIGCGCCESTLLLRILHIRNYCY